MVEVENGSIVDLNCEGELIPIIPYYKYRPCSQIATFDEAEEVNQRDTSAHKLTESNVIPMVRVSASILVAEPAVAALAVIVGPIYGRAYRQRQLARLGLENPLRADERDADAPDLKTALQDRPGKDIVVFGNPFGEPAKGGTTYGGVTHLDKPMRTGRPSSIKFSLYSYWRMGRMARTHEAFTRTNTIVPGFALVTIRSYSWPRISRRKK